MLLGTFWIGLYLLLASGPLAIAFFGDPPQARSFWIEFSVALGFIGLAMIALQFVITARIDHINGPYGIDVIYRFHRHISIVAFLLILAHPLILFLAEPAEYLPLLAVWDAPARAVMAWAALLGLVAIVVSSIWRIRLGLSYEAWRVLHGILAIIILALALGHALGVGHYLAQFWQQALWIAMGGLVVLVTTYVRLIKPFLMKRRPWQVANVTPERGNCWTLELEPRGHRGIRFRPGQFAWITVGPSVWMVQEHPFSFSTSAERTDRVGFTIKENGDFTNQIGRIAPGTEAYLDGPHGVFTIDRRPGVEGAVYIAGGIGITPMMSMLRTLADRGDQRPHLLIYANQDWESVTFRDELPQLEQRLNLRTVHVLQKPPDQWQGETGMINAPLLDRHLPQRRGHHEHYICGPAPMITAAHQALAQVGVPLERIESEEFVLV